MNYFPIPLPGDVIFVHGNKFIEHHQKKKGVEAREITHVALVADSNLVFEANISSWTDPLREYLGKEVDCPNRLLSFEDWFDSRPIKGDKGFTVLRSPAAYEDFLGPLLDNICFHRREQYSLRTLLKGDEFKDGKSICSVLVRKVLSKAGIIPKTSEIQQSILPGELYQVLLDNKFFPIDWKEYKKRIESTSEPSTIGLIGHCEMLDAIQDAETAWGDFLGEARGYSSYLNWQDELEVRQYFRRKRVDEGISCFEFVAKQLELISNPNNFTSFLPRKQAAHWMRAGERQKNEEYLRQAYLEHLRLIYLAVNGITQICMRMVHAYLAETKIEVDLNIATQIQSSDQTQLQDFREHVIERLGVWADLGGTKDLYLKRLEVNPNWEMIKPEWMEDTEFEFDLFAKGCAAAFSESLDAFNYYPQAFVKRIFILEGSGVISDFGDLLQ